MMTFLNYNLELSDGGLVVVRDPRWPEKPLYVATSMGAARAFVRAFRDGTTWAAQAALR